MYRSWRIRVGTRLEPSSSTHSVATSLSVWLCTVAFPRLLSHSSPFPSRSSGHHVYFGAHRSTHVLGAYLLGVGNVIAVVIFLRAGEWLADRGFLETLVQPAPDTSMAEQS
jgi:hypothetical protein